MVSLKSILKEVKNELKEKEELKESTQTQIRKAASHSKQAILLIHQEKIEEAEKLLEKTKETISKLNKALETHQEIVNYGLFSAARQEYSEATILLNLVKKSKFASHKDICISPVDYVLGLADVIGELRRLALDAVRTGNVKKGENALQTMDEIYVELMALDEVYMLVPGLRRKCDVARKIIDITRGDITQEVRRQAFETHLENFRKELLKRT